LDHGCIDLLLTEQRIKECVEEYKKRGLNWKYAIPSESDVILLNSYLERYEDITQERRIEMTEMNIRVLAFRCPGCRTRLRKGINSIETIKV
jgi:hypothetical protein